MLQLGQQNQSVLGHGALQRHRFKDATENSKGGHPDEAEQAQAGSMATRRCLAQGPKQLLPSIA